MRTTISLDPDVAALIKQTMADRGVSFKQAVNEAIKRGLTGDREETAFTTPTFPMGKAAVPLTHALRLAAEMEDEEIVRKLSVRK